MEIDLPEIQEINSREIIKVKLLAASEHHDGEFIVEDTSLSIDCLGDLPGPFIKWFEKALGNENLANIVEKFENKKAVAKVVIGYKKDDQINYFEGSIDGIIVKPRGDKDWGW